MLKKINVFLMSITVIFGTVCVANASNYYGEYNEDEYPDEIDVDQIYMKRCSQAITVFLIVFVMSIGGGATGGQNVILNLVFAAVIAHTPSSRSLILVTVYRQRIHIASSPSMENLTLGC